MSNLEMRDNVSEPIQIGNEGARQSQPAAPAYGLRGLDSPRPGYPGDPRQKSPALATLLSLMPGLGQVYVGYYEQGFINILIVASLITLLNLDIETLAPFCGFFLAFFWLYNLVDAYRKATFYNQALAGIGPLELPPESGIAKGRGSLVGGAALILMGAMFLAHTRFGYSLDWLRRWWPVALVALGAYLVYRAASEHRKDQE